MSDDISQLIGRLRSYARSSKGDIFAAVDTIEALRAERDRLKDEVERLRNEKVAGVAALKAAGAGLSPASGQAPATDPAPAVCEWTRTPYTALYSSCCDKKYLRNVTDSGMCHRCGLPIKFTEAKA